MLFFPAVFARFGYHFWGVSGLCSWWFIWLGIIYVHTCVDTEWWHLLRCLRVCKQLHGSPTSGTCVALFFTQFCYSHVILWQQCLWSDAKSWPHHFRPWNYNEFTMLRYQYYATTSSFRALQSWVQITVRYISGPVRTFEFFVSLSLRYLLVQGIPLGSASESSGIIHVRTQPLHGCKWSRKVDNSPLSCKPSIVRIVDDSELKRWR